jgi:putative ABC transport system permease protein
VSTISPDQPVSDVRPLAAIVRDQTASRTVQLTVIGIFAGVALLLAGLGIHGLLGFVVSQRSREIGLRMALGADRGDVFRMVTRRTAWLLLGGLAPGLVVAALAAKGLEGVLVGVSPADPVAYGGALALCVVTAALGCLVPLRRAVRVEPASALRSE